jgi:hypothetical protein
MAATNRRRKHGNARKLPRRGRFEQRSWIDKAARLIWAVAGLIRVVQRALKQIYA